MSTCTCEKQDRYANCCKAKRYEEEAARLKRELSVLRGTVDLVERRHEEKLASIGAAILSQNEQLKSAEAALLAERAKSKRLADILGQMSTSCVPPLHNCGTCMRARAALEGK